MKRNLAVFFIFALPALSAGFEAGVSRIRVTPDTPIWMSGYAQRSRPSDRVVQELWAKALAIRDPTGARAVIVTIDVIGLPRAIAELAAARIQKEYGLERSALMLNSAHIHTGPVLRNHLVTMWDLAPEELARIDAYSTRLTDALVTVTGAALGAMQPAALAFGEGQAGFAVNRRQPTASGVKIGVNPSGPRDLSVPVLRVSGKDGRPLAILFGYACHNTTLGGDSYEVSGDYAGFAQADVEKAYPGATAMFVMLCGGDQNPNPRGTLSMAAEHGASLAREVGRVLGGRLKDVRPPLRTAFRIVEPKFAPHTRETFEQQLKEKNLARVRTAQAMLKAYDEGRPVRRIPYPVQAIRFGKDLTLLALGGEPVVDYALRAKREFKAAKEPLVVAGYTNDVMCYIPSVRILKEGGYEAVDSMWFYGQPGPFSEDVEEIVFGAMRSVLERVGRK